MNLVNSTERADSVVGVCTKVGSFNPRTPLADESYSPGPLTRSRDQSIYPISLDFLSFTARQPVVPPAHPMAGQGGMARSPQGGSVSDAAIGGGAGLTAADAGATGGSNDTRRGGSASRTQA